MSKEAKKRTAGEDLKNLREELGENLIGMMKSAVKDEIETGDILSSSIENILYAMDIETHIEPKIDEKISESVDSVLKTIDMSEEIVRKLIRDEVRYTIREMFNSK